jgi:hypothetical protein
LCQALSDYEHAVELGGGIVEQEFKNSVLATIAIARATKTTACLMHHFDTTTDPGKLRGLVQGEIRELRNASLKEKEALPGLLYKRVQAALAMRT